MIEKSATLLIIPRFEFVAIFLTFYLLESKGC